MLVCLCVRCVLRVSVVHVCVSLRDVLVFWCCGVSGVRRANCCSWVWEPSQVSDVSHQAKHWEKGRRKGRCKTKDNKTEIMMWIDAESKLAVGNFSF